MSNQISTIRIGSTVQRLVLPLLAFLFMPSAQDAIHAQASLQTIQSFHRGPQSPWAGVIEGSDGALYGTTFWGGIFDDGTLFRIHADGTGFTLLHHFDCFDGTNGCNPGADLIEGSDGALYGTTRDGGASFLGAVFRIEKDGTDFSLVHSFVCPNAAVTCVPSGVIEGSDGALYGTTQAGGAFGDGEAFRVNKDGSGYTVLHTFRRDVGNGEWRPSNSGARAGLVEGSDGRLYGTTERGGAFDDGIVFVVNRDGTGYAVLHDFECPAFDSCQGRRPNSGLIQASDGALYGTTTIGNKVFKINTDGTGFAVVYDLSDSAVFNTAAGVIEASDGALYGTATFGGDFEDGVLFRVDKDGTGFSVVHSLECGSASIDGCLPFTGVIEASDGTLYATATSTAGFSTGDDGMVFTVDKDGTGFMLLHAFRCGGPGCVPEAPLLEASDGALYGTTDAGGAFGAGVLFRIDQDGSAYAVLHDFECSTTSGCRPSDGGLIEASDGALYGTTWRGGAFDVGTAFAIDKDGTGFAHLHSFDSEVRARLLEASDGALYGTTQSGGLAQGTVFRLEKDGTGFTELHAMTGASDGVGPQGGLIEASDGALYGVNGSSGPLGGGTAFRIDRDGTGFTVLHSFQSVVSNGSFPLGGLTEGSDGVLYGATFGGGASLTGTVYRINRDGTGFTLLHSLACNGDGCRPRGGVTEGSDGALYGTASVGFGATSRGSVFRLRKDGTDFTVLHPFVFPCTGDNGCFPFAGVIEGSDGAFYGTTREGGGGAGTLYRLTLDMVSVPPTLVVTSPEPGAVVPEGQVLVEGTASDDVAVASVTVDGIDAVLTSTGNPEDPNEVAFSMPLVLEVGDHTIEVIATDDEGNTQTALVDVHAVSFDDMGPRVANVTADPNPAEVGAPVLLTAEVDDSATGDSSILSASYTIDGGQPVPMWASDGAFDSSQETVEAEIPGFSPSGVYEICVTAEDEVGNVGGPTCTLLALYDPGAGFATGGGWIDSLPGAYRPDLSASGKGNFGFVAKYKPGSSIPMGSTEFQLHEASLNLHSSGYEWLVVTEDDTAQYKGVGTVNGSVAPNGDLYHFMVWAGDGEPDTFRIRIWWEDSGQEIELYDSETTILGGGSIVIH